MQSLASSPAGTPANLEVVHFDSIANRRTARYHMTNDLKLKTRDEAVRFINEVGVALLFPGDNLPLPDLWSAINGKERKLPKHHHDWALGKTWDWKDQIPSRKEAWYGKLIRGKPAFVSLRDLPAVYALSSNYGELDDYLEAYQDGMLSQEAKSVYEVLLAEGPLPTSTLRKASGLGGGGDNARRFERAIVELQTGLKIVKAGISDSNRWKYCYVYDLLLRWAPNLAEESRNYNSRSAMRHLIGRYLQSNLAAPPLLFPRLFAWDTNVTLRVIDEMVQDGTLDQIRVLKAPGLTSRAKPAPEGEVWVTMDDGRW
ncbi:MAG: winged helix DNA-binding domain-containing protein [Chloroflexota bacterium]|nr:winged helix DNA-binding domain-containing protein [Chloroflexota bacterium]